MFVFRKNLASFVFFKHPFWDSPFFLITDDIWKHMTNISEKVCDVWNAKYKNDVTRWHHLSKNQLPYCKVPYKCHHTIYEDDHTARSLTNVTTPYMQMTILQDALQMSPHHICRWPYCKIPYKCHHTIYADDHTARCLTNVTTPYMQMTIL